MGVKKDIIDTPLKITEIFRVGPRVKAPRDKRDWDFLIYELKKMQENGPVRAKQAALPPRLPKIVSHL